MKKINVDGLNLIIDNNILSIKRKRLIKIDNIWKVETYLEDICYDILLDCEQCVFKTKHHCLYKEWKPGLKKGRKW